MSTLSWSSWRLLVPLTAAGRIFDSSFHGTMTRPVPVTVAGRLTVTAAPASAAVTVSVPSPAASSTCGSIDRVPPASSPVAFNAASRSR